ncbi:O-antigen ligase family protein [Pontibacter oryzae]|uniref:O-antigen ligase domain-containing protein n=1 Tax=Pontibacter oryzae TaxID=2304593 RepID=A0A399SJ65_9BACT|nr:O-antigen ligase family protein [Pontibacter oryzae]RIJ42523.1 O-antigen ligase domain-containing protein [Pontibacter oryzae]
MEAQRNIWLFAKTNILPTIGILALAAVLAVGVAYGGLLVALAYIAIPCAIFGVSLIVAKPKYGLLTVVVFGFLANGLTRYVPAPLGLSIDLLLVLTLLGVLFSQRSFDTKQLNNSLTILTVLWFVYTLFEIVNPEARSLQAWFYAVRGVSLYMLFIIPLTFLLMRSEKDLDMLLMLWLGLSLLGTLWGIRQFAFGPDSAEQAWLNAGGAVTHILFGKLRVFSFYSDAGQFGASQAHASVVAGILAMGERRLSRRLIFIFIALLSFYGMLISGTRGAFFVIVGGGACYLIAIRNMRLIILGLVIGGLAFGFLKYTTIGQSNYQINRLRTALDPNDASLLVRIENQRKLADFLATRPFGGGIGSGGSWGQRFSPNSFLAQTALDSWYVKIWAESGIVGLVLHVCSLLFIMGIGFLNIYNLQPPDLKYKMIAIFSGLGGIILASYGNQLLGQMPTGVLVYMTMVYLYLPKQFLDDRQNKLYS